MMKHWALKKNSFSPIFVTDDQNKSLGFTLSQEEQKLRTIFGGLCDVETYIQL